MLEYLISQYIQIQTFLDILDMLKFSAFRLQFWIMYCILHVMYMILKVYVINLYSSHL